MKKNIILFYKRLLTMGGAERLLLKEYQYFKNENYLVKIVCLEYNSKLEITEQLSIEDLYVVNQNGFLKNILYLAGFLKRNSNAIFICNSGYIDFYFASLIGGVNYYLHIHQPSFMSFNETDKYSFLMRKAFRNLIDTNYGASSFIKIKHEMSLYEKFSINIRSIFSYGAVRRAKAVFVLSNYAKKEKKLMYGIDAHNISGALDASIFDYSPTNIDRLPKKSNQLLTIARLDKNKRIDKLIMAFSLFVTKHPDSVLVIGGEGVEYKNLTQLVSKLNLNDKVTLIGFVPDHHLYDYYNWADLFVSIDWADFRITSYEAMAMGTKVLLSDETDADQDLLKSGYYYLTKPDAEDVASNIEKALFDRHMITKFHLMKRLKKYTWSRYFSNMERIISV